MRCVSRSLRPPFGNNPPTRPFVLPLKKREDHRGLRLGHLACVFLHNHGFDGVVVRDNHKALYEKNRKKDKKQKGGGSARHGP